MDVGIGDKFRIVPGFSFWDDRYPQGGKDFVILQIMIKGIEES